MKKIILYLGLLIACGSAKADLSLISPPPGQRYLIANAPNSANLIVQTLTTTATGQFTIISSSGLRINGGGLRFADGTILYSTSAILAAGGSTPITFDDFRASANGVTTNFVLSQTPSNSSSVFVMLDGLNLSRDVDFTFIPPQTISLTTAPLSSPTGFRIYYQINATNVSGVATLSGNQTFTGPILFSSSVTINGALIVNTTTTFNGPIIYNTVVAASSATRVYNTFFTNSVYVGVSTVSITSDGKNPIVLTWEGNVLNNGNSVGALFFQDGNYYSGLNSNSNFVFGSSGQNGTLQWLLDSPVPAAGAHTYAFAVKTDAGTAAVCTTNLGAAVCQWSARVLH